MKKFKFDTLEIDLGTHNYDGLDAIFYLSQRCKQLEIHGMTFNFDIPSSFIGNLEHHM